MTVYLKTAATTTADTAFANIPGDIRSLLPASYEELDNFHQVQDTLAYTSAQLGGYFHKYFPRSYTETFKIVDKMFDNSEYYRNVFSARQHLGILDVGAGIGGNMIGMLKYISRAFPAVQSVSIDSIDGNSNALKCQERIINNISLSFSVRFNPTHHVFSSQSMIPDLQSFTAGAQKGYDIIMCSKFINEFYRKSSDVTGLYSDFIEFGGGVLKNDGFMMITELTDRLDNHGFLNQLFNQETRSYYKNRIAPLTQVFPVQCHLWRDCCEDGDHCFVQQRFLSNKAKVFTQIFCHTPLGSKFYDRSYLDEKKRFPVKIKNTGHPSGRFCYRGKLRDSGDL